MPKTPCVSVVMPTYRRSELMVRAVRSVLDQSYHDFELVVVDDNGEGHPEQIATRERLSREFDDSRIHYHINPGPHGGSGARNLGIHVARGRYVAFVDDDEDWLPEKLAEQVAYFENSEPTVGVVHTGFYDWKPDGSVREARPKMDGWIFERLLNKTGGRAPKLSTIMCRREVFDEVGAFDSQLPAREDYDLYLRIARRYQFRYLSEPLSNKRADASDRLTSDPRNFVLGFEGIYCKLRPELNERPHTHAIYLLRYAEVLALAGEKARARDKYFQAACLWWFNPRLITYGIKLLRNQAR